MKTARPFARLHDRRGAVLPLVAISLVALLSLTALAVDLGMLHTSKADAQRAADAAALAGASTYMEANPVADTARDRAASFVGRNYVMGTPVAPAEARVVVDHPNTSVTVRVARRQPTVFARIFRIDTVDVVAVATARVTSSGSAACVKPFALPNDIYQNESDWGTEKKIWEQKDDADGFVLVGFDGQTPGLGNIEPLISSTNCDQGTVSTGQAYYRAPDDTRLGQVRNGFDNLIDSDPYLTWSPTGPYNGFNRADWVSSPRVALIPLYDPAVSNPQPGGTGTVTITGFLTVFFTRMDRTPPPQPHDRVWGVILRTTGVSDVCTSGLCTETTPVLQLVQ